LAFNLSLGWNGGMHLIKPLPRTAHRSTCMGSPCGSRVCGGRPRFRRYKRTPHPWIRKKKDEWWRTPTLEMVSIKTPRGRLWETTSLLFPKLGPWLVRNGSQEPA